MLNRGGKLAGAMPRHYLLVQSTNRLQFKTAHVALYNVPSAQWNHGNEKEGEPSLPNYGAMERRLSAM